MKGIHSVLVAATLLFSLVLNPAFAGDWQFGIGFNAGVSRLEGDLNSSRLSPLLSGHLRALPIPYLGLDGTLGYSPLGASNNFQTKIIPFELSVIFNFLPFHKVNPYVFVGGGGVFWSASSNNATLEDGLDSFLKTGGGLEFKVSRSFGINLGATYRYSLTDAFDQLRQGDENDQVLDAHAGFTYYFGGHKGDRDHDSIPDELDLMPEIAEDRDGYLDHDGIPEKNPASIAFKDSDGALENDIPSPSPVVVHHLIDKAESGKNIPIKAFIYSNVPLRVVAALYRPVGIRKWNVVRLETFENNLYEGEIPGYAVTVDGLEYCVVAVDETLSGIGYSGLPSKPVNIAVTRSGTPWRIVGGVAGAAAVGTASYLVLRKQE